MRGALEALAHLCRGLAPAPFDDDVTLVGESQLPEAFHRLLAHAHHMTPTLRDFHGREVGLSILREAFEGDGYRRHIVLVAPGSDRAVEVGVVRIEMRMLAKVVQRDILERRSPLGDILLEHRVLTQIRPRCFLRLSGRSELVRPFGGGEGDWYYGRLAAIYCDGQEALELLEIVTDRRCGGDE